jgi:hypothetical protein
MIVTVANRNTLPIWLRLRRLGQLEVYPLVGIILVDTLAGPST